jgi:hypothetical protein
MHSISRRTVMAAMSAAALAPSRAASPRTTVSIRGDGFLINGKPTYPKRVYNGHMIEGLLFTSRMANAIVDDHNPETRGVWAYSDGPWDAERNTSEFIAALPAYRASGMNSVAINLQGGSPQGYSWHQPWQLSGFDADGHLLADYRRRLERVLAATGSLGMVVILGLFYISAKPALRDEVAVLRAVDEVVEFLCASGHSNVLIEIGNEIDLSGWAYDIVKPARSHELVERIQKASAGRLKTPARRLLVSTSFVFAAPPENFLAVADYVLLHGNDSKTPEALRALIRSTRAAPGYKSQPLLINEDDHYDFDKPDNDFLAAVEDHCGWGFFDYRRDRERFADGYQSLPVDWAITSPRKKAFFDLLHKVTGGAP